MRVRNDSLSCLSRWTWPPLVWILSFQVLPYQWRGWIGLLLVIHDSCVFLYRFYDCYRWRIAAIRIITYGCWAFVLDRFVLACGWRVWARLRIWFMFFGFVTWTETGAITDVAAWAGVDACANDIRGLRKKMKGCLTWEESAGCNRAVAGAARHWQVGAINAIKPIIVMTLSIVFKFSIYHVSPCCGTR